MANDTSELSPPPQSEETPLLDLQLCDSTQSSTSARLSPAILIIPVAIASRLAGQLPVTTFLQIINKLVCRIWYEWNDPDMIPLNGRVPESFCARPEIEHNYSASVTVFEVIEGVGVMIACSAASFFASRCGRKPTLLAAFGAVIFSYILVVASQFTVTANVEAFMLCVSMVFQALSSSIVTGFIVNMYIVDVSTAEERTIALSTINGWLLGGALSYTVGGLITTLSNRSILVYLVAIAMLTLSCIYIVLVLPESFPEEKREELRRIRLAQAEAELALGSSQRSSALWYALTALNLPFEPLKQLTPKRKWNGKYNLRLLYCAAHVLVTQIGSRYAPMGITIYYTAKYSYNPAQIGYIISALFLSSVVTLTTIIPMIVRFLRPFYKKRTGAYEEGEVSSNEIAETSGKLELHIVFVSWILAALAMAFAGSAPTFPWQLFAVTCVGISTGHVPVFRSVVAASAEPLKQGETLAAVEMVSSVGQTLSPVIMGTVLTVTIATLPQLVFYVHGVFVILGAFILFFIKDSDRYKTSYT
ncbi:MFS general substrate transporter [Hygrophoropsis aurantiaca]|uniref:MFS general substrate transporter n=1 Tax=Hygrophoropsis aurantiaca TaxID=72124 RepID=A0ACB8A7A6_9AGAM|nr:MFS general substrate transporter [Hygrophoropsis aurantiaca]